jgi:hypothetical protein
MHDSMIIKVLQITKDTWHHRSGRTRALKTSNCLLLRRTTNLLRKLPPLHISSRLSRACLVVPHSRIDLINSIERQAQELVLIIPPDILLLELLQLLRWWRRFRDLGDEIGGRCFGNAVDEHAQKRDFQKEEESDCEAVEYAGAVVEPEFLLLGGVADAGEVGVELWD